jgi:hypothetical protein
MHPRGCESGTNEENTMSIDPIEKALSDIAAVQNADKVILFVDPWSDPLDGLTVTSTICNPSELSLGSGGYGDAIMVGTEAKATLTCFVNQTDLYLILPIERLTGEHLETALDLIRTTLATISEENDGRCGYVWNRFDNAEVPTSEIVIGEEIILPNERFAAADLIHVSAFPMTDDADLGESSVEMFFADGRAARLRGGIDWFNHCH